MCIDDGIVLYGVQTDSPTHLHVLFARARHTLMSVLTAGNRRKPTTTPTDRRQHFRDMGYAVPSTMDFCLGAGGRSHEGSRPWSVRAMLAAICRIHYFEIALISEGRE